MQSGLKLDVGGLTIDLTWEQVEAYLAGRNNIKTTKAIKAVKALLKKEPEFLEVDTPKVKKKEEPIARTKLTKVQSTELKQIIRDACRGKHLTNDEIYQTLPRKFSDYKKSCLNAYLYHMVDTGLLKADKVSERGNNLYTTNLVFKTA
jgi:hypothetical protein